MAPYRIFIFTTISCLVTLCCFAYFGDKSTYFVGNLAPEGIGLTLEILIVAIIVERLQERDNRIRKISKEKRLREYLIFLLKKCFWREFEGRINYKKPLKEFFWGINRCENLAFLRYVSEQLNDPDYNREWKEKLRKHLKSESQSYKHCLPVAADISEAHFKAWMRLIYFTDVICRSRNIGKKEILDLLKQLDRFDKASFDEKIYVQWHLFWKRIRTANKLKSQNPL